MTDPQKMQQGPLYRAETRDRAAGHRGDPVLPTTPQSPYLYTGAMRTLSTEWPLSGKQVALGTRFSIPSSSLG